MTPLRDGILDILLVFECGRDSLVEAAVPAEWVILFGSIYAVACQMCLQVSGFWLRQRHVFDRVSFFFETGHKFQREVNALFNGLSQRPEYQELFRYHSHTFINKTEAYGLQAADLLAWSLARAHVGGMTKAPLPRALRPFRETILTITDVAGRYHCNRFTGEVLKRFIAEQTEQMPELLVDVGPRKKALR